ncbi:serine/threonine-protein kinase VRK1-like [Periplaneta americana]|uniref:serine/threonine-protein kinase VRK1-like n=1 Tax=Periplaneta americana TaxID=6978 RepID=UPI0037E7C6D4
MSLKTNKAAPVKKAQGKRKAANGYKLPDPIPNGEIIKDVAKKQWQIGPSIGVGGFGEIYSASDVSDSPRKQSSLPYVVKIEPHGNGPLFVEMHFYIKVAKPDQIEEWMKQKKLKSLGMPRYLGSGSHECNGQKYRFVVMDRYGKDLWSLFLQNNRLFPLPTIFRVGLQIINILEYIHSKGYVHADIKGSNLLLGLHKGTENQVYLVDFGLASRYSKEYKPDPKKAHNGTIEYTSRDAHVGVSTRRGDLEILGYNLVQWMTSKLPWENNLRDSVHVHQQKNKYMDNIPEFVKKCFQKTNPPGAMVKYLEYVASLKDNEEPDYGKCKKLLELGLKECKCSVEGKLEFSGKGTKKASPRKGKNTSPSSDSECSTSDTEPSHKKNATIRKKNKTKQNRDDSIDDISSESDEEDEQTNGRAKPRNANKNNMKKPASSWRDCPTAIASNVNKAGEYKRAIDDAKEFGTKKQKKTGAFY